MATRLDRFRETSASELPGCGKLVLRSGSVSIIHRGDVTGVGLETYFRRRKATGCGSLLSISKPSQRLLLPMSSLNLSLKRTPHPQFPKEATRYTIHATRILRRGTGQIQLSIQVRGSCRDYKSDLQIALYGAQLYDWDTALKVPGPRPARSGKPIPHRDLRYPPCRFSSRECLEFGLGRKTALYR